MNIKKTLRNLGIAGILGIASLMPVTKANALDGNIRQIQSEDNATSYVEANAFYKLPADIKGFTFVDFYKNGDGYFGKTSLEKAVDAEFGLKTQIIHANEPFTQAGLGASAVVPYTPKETFAKISLMPVWFNRDGIVEDKVVASYFVTIDLPKGFKLSSFGEWDLGEKGGPKWTYGEIDLGRKFGPVKLSYNPALIGDGDSVPRLEHRISLGIDF